MLFKPNANETLSTGAVAAESTVTITAANADELFALVAMHRGVLVDDMPVAAAPGDIGPAYATFVARRAESGLSLSDAAPVVGATAGSFLARVRTRYSGAAVTLVDDGGGRVALNGKTLVAGSTAFVAGSPVNIILAVGGEQRTFTLYPAAKRGTVVVTPPPTPTLTLSPSAVSIATDAAAGVKLADIGNVPSGVTPTISPNDGRAVIGGSAGAWTVLRGMTAVSAGNLAYTVNATGATGAALSVTVTAAGSGGSLGTFAYTTETTDALAAMAAAGSPLPARAHWHFDRMLRRLNSLFGGSYKTALLSFGVAQPTETQFMQNLANLARPLTKIGNPVYQPNVGFNNPAGVGTTGTYGHAYDTGVAYSETTLNDSTFGVFTKGSGIGVTAGDMGVVDANGLGFNMIVRNVSNLCQVRNQSLTFTASITTPWSGEGWHVSRRSGATTGVLSHHGELVHNVATASGTMAAPTRTFHVGQANGASSATPRIVSGWMIAKRCLTPYEDLMFCAITRDYMDSVERGFIDITPAGYGPAVLNVDVLAYGLTMAAVAGAYDAKKFAPSQSVALLGEYGSSTVWDIGGMPSAGLGETDALDPTSVSDFYKEVTRGCNIELLNRSDEATQKGLSFEGRYFNHMLRKALDPTRNTGILPGVDVPVYFSGGLQSVTQKPGLQGWTIVTADGRTINAKRVLWQDDQGYGVKMSGAPIIYGKEARGTGKENLNGFGGDMIRYPRRATSEVFYISPYVVAGDPASGLLPSVVPFPSTPIGDPIESIEPLNMRVPTMDHASRIVKMPTLPSVDWNPMMFEDIGRLLEAATAAAKPISIDYWLKTDGLVFGSDSNNGTTGLSTDMPNSGKALLAAGKVSQAAMRAVETKVLNYSMDFFWFMQYSGDARVSSGLQSQFRNLGLDATSYLDVPDDRKMFQPTRAYVRDPICRMKNTGYVHTANDIAMADGTTPRSVRTAAIVSYELDNHSEHRVAYNHPTQGMVIANLNAYFDTSVSGGADKRSTVPMEALLPDKSFSGTMGSSTAPSVTDVAWRTCRMEPTKVQGGGSLGILAALSIQQNCAMQDVDYSQFVAATQSLGFGVPSILPQVN